MINFRFHIVSLTAVLLALGIGLVLGTTFLDDATVKELKNQLEGLETDLDQEGSRNTALRRQLDDFEDEAAGLDEQLGARLFDGLLQDDPVLVIAPAGIADESVDGVIAALDQADADVAGVWKLTERLALDDAEEVTDLATALELSTDDADRLRDNLAMQLADVLFGASDQNIQTGLQTAPAEPGVAARLREAGFVEYELPDSADGDVVRLPPGGLRIAVVSGPGSAVPTGEVLLPILVDLASDDAVPVVAADPSLVPDEGSGDGDEEQPRLVTAIRDDDELSQRISTVDDLDRVAGRVATVLALVDAEPGDPRVGHYGSEDGTMLLPEPREGDGS
ncbi:MAG: copper transporter [Acidimicrobiales bacterium]